MVRNPSEIVSPDTSFCFLETTTREITVAGVMIGISGAKTLERMSQKQRMSDCNDHARIAGSISLDNR